MPSSNVVDPVCPKNYTLQTDRMKYRLCKCIKNTDENDYDYRDSSDTYKKVQRRVTVKKPGKQNRCPSGTRYNRKTGYCEGRTKQGRSLMSVLFKDGEVRDVKTKRRTVKARVEKRRAKCPDGYVINHKLGLCERRGLRKSRGRHASPLRKTYRAKTMKRKQPLGDSYYETVSPIYKRAKTARAKTARAKTARAKTARARTARAPTALRQPTMRPRTVKPRYNFRNTPYQQPGNQKKKVRLIEPSQMVRKHRPEYVSLKDYLARNQGTNKKTYRKTPAKPALKSAMKTAPKTAQKKKAFF